MKVQWQVNINPHGFDEVPGFPGIHIAKTKVIVDGNKIIPALTLWFRIDEVSRVVTKLYIEMTDPDEMRYLENGDNFL